MDVQLVLDVLLVDHIDMHALRAILTSHDVHEGLQLA